MKLSNEIKAGLFIVFSLLLLVMSIFVMGRERQIFASQSEYRVAFRDIKGLAPGAPVRLGGISIGRVEKVSFAETITDPNVHVKLLINEDFLDRIRTDSTVTIETQGLLGDRFINISTGAQGEHLQPNSYLRSEESGDMAQILAKAQRVVDQTVEIAQNINTLLKDFNTSSVPEIKEAVSAFKDIGRQVRDGDGFVHRLIYSKKDGDEILSSIEKTSKAVSEVTEQIKNGQGVLHALVYEPRGKETIDALADAAQRIAVLSESLAGVSTQIQTGDGIIHDLIYSKSPHGLNEIMENLRKTSNNLQSASLALSEGSGTLGALLVDPQLYNNLVEVTDGAKRSFILREAIKSSLGQ
jgi:phospholipid/cholesterol/gamma-HCH transport system substrate-binding protein